MTRVPRFLLFSIVLSLTVAALPAGRVAAQAGGQAETRSVPVEQAAPPGEGSPQPEEAIVIHGGEEDGEEAASAPTIGGIATVGLNFEMSRLFADSGFIPPDTMAAVGPRHVVELINGNFEVFDKTTGASIETMSLDAFWTTRVGLGIVNNGRFDPRILYDPLSERWFAVSIDNVIDNVPAGGDGVNEAANNIFVGRSDTDDPTGDWDGFSFNADSVGALEFHDYPTLGLDADGLYTCTQDFDGGGNESCYSIPKVDLLAAAPTAANLTRFEATPAGLPAVSGSWQPAVNRGLSLGRAPLLGVDGGGLLRTSIFSAGGPGAFLPAAANVILGDPGHAAPPAARQPLDFAGDLHTIENVAPRFVGNVIVEGTSLWAAHAVAGTGGSSAIQWYEIDEGTNAVLQFGLIEHDDFDYHEPSIAVNEFGDVVIGYTCSGVTLPASVCASVGRTVGGVTTLQPPAVLFAGTGVYYRDFCTPPGCSERNRWGDYSATVVDPTDPCTFWTFQEYTAQGAGNVDVGPGAAEGGLWGTRAVELTFDGCAGNNVADLAIDKLCKPDTPLQAGQTGFCELSVINFGPASALDVVVVDRFLSNGTFTLSNITTTKGTCSLTPDPQTVTCELGRLAVNETVLIHVDVTANTAQTVNNIATVSSSTHDPDSSNNRDEGSLVFTFTATADLQIEKTDTPDPVIAGTNLTYEITVTNLGPSTAANVTVSDLLPAVLSIVSVSASDGGSCNAGIPGSVPTTCAFGNVPNGGIRTMTIVTLVAANALPDSIISNNASVSSSTEDPNNANNLATTTTLVAGSADLALTKSDSPDPVAAGAILTYTIGITNLGPSWARDVVVSDTLPVEVAFVSAVIGGGAGVCAPSGGSPTVVTCTLGDLANGGVRSITLQTTVSPSTPDGTILSNTATVTATTSDPDPVNNSDTETTAVVTQADIWVDKTAEVLTGNPSRTIRYTLAVYNRPGCEADDALSCGTGGPSDAQDVVVTDTLPLDPKKIRVVFVSQNCTYNEGAHQVVCNVAGGTLPFGQVATFIVDVQPVGNVGTITNSVSVTSSTTDPNPANNTDQVQMIVRGGSARPGQ